LLDRSKKALKPDLDSHSLIRFLDKFVYRNPKAADSTRGSSIMQPLRASKDLGDIWLGSRGGPQEVSVNSSAFRSKKAEDVAAEDVFFHEYFQHAAREPKKQSKASADGEDEDQEDEIWQALVSAQPDVEGGDDSDVGFDDLDEDEMASDDESLPEDSLGEESDEDIDALLADEDGDDAESDGLVAIDEDEDGIEIRESDKSKGKDKNKSRRKALRDLPMFASVDDYAELLGAEEDEDM
jgi:ribosome biogenesis protein MAK21